MSLRSIFLTGSDALMHTQRRLHLFLTLHQRNFFSWKNDVLMKPLQWSRFCILDFSRAGLNDWSLKKNSVNLHNVAYLFATSCEKKNPQKLFQRLLKKKITSREMFCTQNKQPDLFTSHSPILLVLSLVVVVDVVVLVVVIVVVCISETFLLKEHLSSLLRDMEGKRPDFDRSLH